MRERSIETQVCDYARGRGFLVLKTKTVNDAGRPDRVFCRHGRYFFVEFKRPGETPTRLQQHTVTQMRAQGHRVYVIDSTEAGKAIVDLEAGHLDALP